MYSFIEQKMGGFAGHVLPWRFSSRIFLLIEQKMGGFSGHVLPWRFSSRIFLLNVLD